VKVLGIQKDSKTPSNRRTPIWDIGPNEAIIYSVPGAGNRRIIDTTYEVDTVIDGKWRTVARYSESRIAFSFARGLAYGIRIGMADTAADLNGMYWEGFGS
jgi:hypothetical protein